MTDWDLNRAALRHHLKTEKIENFLRWSTVEKTMFVANAPYIRKEYAEISIPYYSDLHQAIKEPCIGAPIMFYDNYTSGNLIHQAYHLKQLKDIAGLKPKNKHRIVEVGGGYGAMCLLWRRLGFKGHYVIIDLPELSTLQKYYIHNTRLEGWLTLCDNWEGSCDLLIACHSLSEMPIVERERLLSQVEADAYLFASSYEFEGVDNATWLQQFAGSKVGYDWAQWAHPYQENALYQVGVRL